MLNKASEFGITTSNAAQKWTYVCAQPSVIKITFKYS